MVENDTNRSLIVNKHFFDISTPKVLPASTSSKLFWFGLVGDPSGYQLFNSYHYYNISLFLDIITLTLKIVQSVWDMKFSMNMLQSQKKIN